MSIQRQPQRYTTFKHKGEKWERVAAFPFDNWVMGVDPGRTTDRTAICLMHHSKTPLDDWEVRKDIRRTTQKIEQRFDVVDLRRLPQDMLYPDQAAEIQGALARLSHPCDLVLDDTNFAVGDECQKLGLQPVRVCFTSGTEKTRLGYRRYGVPKTVLVGNVDARLHSNEIHFAKDLTESEALRDEFANLRRTISTMGRMHYEARHGTHDDIVMAIAVAMFWALECEVLKRPIYLPIMGPF